MILKVLFWNVENFVGGEDRTTAVHDHITEFDPDLFCLCEIKDKVALRSLLMQRLSSYNFGLTDGLQQIELLAGWKRNVFEQVMYTQRREFRASQDHLRPGALITAKIQNEWLNFLFLHTDSGRGIRDYQNRQEMYSKIWSLKETLDPISIGPQAMFIAMGDLNTMGRQRSGQFQGVEGKKEIEDLNLDAEIKDMSLKEKTQDYTIAYGPPGNYKFSNLDHVITTNNVTLKNIVGQNGIEAPVDVRGWIDIDDPNEQIQYIEGIADHCSLRINIQI